MKILAICATKGSGERSPRRSWEAPQLFLAVLLGVALGGCSSIINSNTNSDKAVNSAETYLAAGVGNLQTYVIDNTAETFVVNSYSTSGGTVQDSGVISQLSNGIFDFGITYFPGQPLSGPSPIGNWVVEIPGEVALTELQIASAFGANASFAPLVSTQSCPSLTSAESFQFITIPKKLSTSLTLQANGWNPQLETAYGSVSIAATGTSVQFSNISQHTLPSASGGTPGAPINPASASATSACSPTFYGQTISVPSSGTVANPGSASTQTVSPSATIGLGPSGFLLEDSGSAQGASNPSVPPYQNVLGAGYGAIGMPKPSSALSTSTVVAARYQGILYGAASGSSASISSPGFRLIGSFGYPSLTTACPTLPAPSTSTIIYGGEFANNDPSANPYGNCDLAIDLGAQDSSNNGLYPAATVYVSESFHYNGIGSAYSFPAVAIAGQISGKYAIFLIGMDTTGSPSQPWGIYLLQSN